MLVYTVRDEHATATAAAAGARLVVFHQLVVNRIIAVAHHVARQVLKQFSATLHLTGLSG